MKIKRAHQLRKADQIIRYAQKHGAEVREGGRHTKLILEQGVVAVPRHKGDLATGTHRSIIKTLMALGVPIAALLCMASFVLQIAG